MINKNKLRKILKYLEAGRNEAFKSKTFEDSYIIAMNHIDQTIIQITEVLK